MKKDHLQERLQMIHLSAHLFQLKINSNLSKGQLKDKKNGIHILIQ